VLDLELLGLDSKFTRELAKAGPQLKRVMACNPPLEGEFLVMEELVRHVQERPEEVLDGAQKDNGGCPKLLGHPPRHRRAMRASSLSVPPQRLRQGVRCHRLRAGR
jgi:hypothetical protein